MGYGPNTSDNILNGGAGFGPDELTPEEIAALQAQQNQAVDIDLGGIVDPTGGAATGSNTGTDNTGTGGTDIGADLGDLVDGGLPTAGDYSALYNEANDIVDQPYVDKPNTSLVQKGATGSFSETGTASTGTVVNNENVVDEGTETSNVTKDGTVVTDEETNRNTEGNVVTEEDKTVSTTVDDKYGFGEDLKNISAGDPTLDYRMERAINNALSGPGAARAGQSGKDRVASRAAAEVAADSRREQIAAAQAGAQFAGQTQNITGFETVDSTINEFAKTLGNQFSSEEVNSIVNNIREITKDATTETEAFEAMSGYTIGQILGSTFGKQPEGGGGGCCFIFLEARYGDGTMDSVVRRFRDEHMTVRNRRGYYKLAEVLVPLMRRSHLVKLFVRMFMTDPMVSYGKWFYRQGRIGLVFAPVARFWLRMFDYLGGSHPFTRENGEII